MTVNEINPSEWLNISWMQVPNLLCAAVGGFCRNIHIQKFNKRGTISHEPIKADPKVGHAPPVDPPHALFTQGHLFSLVYCQLAKLANAA